jgi:hypothetical protein
MQEVSTEIVFPSVVILWFFFERLADHKSLNILLQWFGLETAKQHVWGGP